MLHDLMGRRAAPYILVSGFILLLLIAGRGDLTLAELASHASPTMAHAGRIVSDFGLSGYMFFISASTAAVALWMRSRAESRDRRAQLALIAERAIYFFAVIGASGILAQVIKHVVGRSRPKLLLEFGAFHFEPFSIKNVLASFPSGHTTTAFSAAVALSFIFPRARVLWFSAAILIGISRVVVGDHYPSDVVGGAALGTWTALLVTWIFAARAIAFESAGPIPRLKSGVAEGAR